MIQQSTFGLPFRPINFQMSLWTLNMIIKTENTTSQNCIVDSDGQDQSQRAKYKETEV